MRKALTIFLALGLLICGFAWMGLRLLEEWSLRPINLPAESLVELRPRMPMKQLARNLETGAVIDQAILFETWMRIAGGYDQFQAGTYLFAGDVTPQHIRDKMIKGDTYIPLVLQISIPEGFTLKQLNERLTTKNVGSMRELNALVRDKKFLRELGVEAGSLEGFTYPATYNFEKMPTCREFYTKTVRTFFEKLPTEFEAQVKAKGLTLVQAVTFASLIELETMQESEKNVIAEVIWRRLKRNEALGIDAALIYGIPNYAGDIKWEHLKDAKNLYNTRIHRGLPPSPIGAPSRSSLEAVLNPTDLGYYYYMLDASDRMRHVFAKTIQEHNANVQRFLHSTPKKK